jgi:hypothetical protein
MTPAHMQLHVDVAERAGFPPIETVGEPGAQGVVVTGMHGCGVRTPCAAEVADATWGFARLEHMPNGAMFTFGW